MTQNTDSGSPQGREQSLSIKQLSFRMLLTACLLVVPLLVIVFLYSSNLISDLQEARDNRKSLEFVELVSEFDAQTLAYFYRVRSQVATVDDEILLDEKLEEVDKFVHENFPGLSIVWRESHWATHEVAKHHNDLLSGDEKRQQMLHVVRERSVLLDEIFERSGLHRSKETDVRSDVFAILKTIPKITQRTLIYSEEIEELKAIDDPVLSGQRIKFLEERLAALKNNIPEITSTRVDMDSIPKLYVEWLVHVERLLAKKKISIFAGLVGGGINDEESSDFSISQQLSKKMLVMVSSKKMEVMKALSNHYIQEENTITSWLVGVFVVVASLIIFSSLLALYIVKNIKLTQYYLSEENQRLEDGIKARTQELEKAIVRTDELNASLMEEKVRAQLLAEKAESANKAKSLFLASMSHEIRTPLNSVIGGSGVLEKTSLSGKQKEVLSLVSQSGKALLELVNDILDFSKIEAGELILETVDFDLESESLEMINILSLRAREKGIDLNFEFTENCEGLWEGDPTRVKQVIMNLLSNAIKFTHEGSVTLKVFNTKEGFGLAVTDTGIGIPEDKQDCLFDAFVQTDNSITRRYGGTGLGLSISKKLTELMGGEITVESEAGKGSTFSMLVPSTRKSVEASNEGKGSICLVGDIEGTQPLAQRLENYGFTIAQSDFQSVRDVLEADAIDLVLLAAADYQRFVSLMARIEDLNVPVAVSYSFNSDAFLRAIPPGISKVNFYTKQDDLRLRLSQLCGMAACPDTLNDGETLESLQLFNGCVLLVEDVEFNQIIAQEVLEGYGVIVECAENGEIATEKVREKAYDLILMDLHMPIMDGWKATDTIREFEKVSGRGPSSIVAMTADVLVDTKEKIGEVGMNGYLPKPFSDDEMLAILLEFLEPKKVRGDSLVQENLTERSSAAIGEGGRLDGAVVFDSDAISKRLKNKMERVKMLCQSFADGLDEMRKNIEKSFNDSDYEKLKYYSHTLKGSAGNVGAMMLFELAKNIDDACKEENYKMAAKNIADLPGSIEAFKNALQSAFSEVS
ncbi:MAG: response regulator [Cellvibrionaceae bacterium]